MTGQPARVDLVEKLDLEMAGPLFNKIAEEAAQSISSKEEAEPNSSGNSHQSGESDDHRENLN